MRWVWICTCLCLIFSGQSDADDRRLDTLIGALTHELGARSTTSIPDCEDEYPRARCTRISATDCSVADGWGESIEAWRRSCHDGTTMEADCRRSCFTRSPSGLPDCSELMTRTTNVCTYDSTTPCSKTCGVGKLVQRFICGGQVEFCQLKCCCQCCCSRESTGTTEPGPEPTVRCSDPGIWVPPLYRSNYCPGYRTHFGKRRSLRRSLNDVIMTQSDDINDIGRTQYNDGIDKRDIGLALEGLMKHHMNKKRHHHHGQ